MKKYIATLFIAFVACTSYSQTAGDKTTSKPTTVSTAAKKGWPSVERVDFINECIRSASAHIAVDSARYYCYCMLDKLETKYPDIKEAEKKMAGGLSEFNDEVQACLKNGSLWKAVDRDEFIAECTKSAREGMSETKATSYCECMLYKVERAYPNPNDANKLTEAVLGTAEWKKKIQVCLDF